VIGPHIAQPCVFGGQCLQKERPGRVENEGHKRRIEDRRRLCARGWNRFELAVWMKKERIEESIAAEGGIGDVEHVCCLNSAELSW